MNEPKFTSKEGVGYVFTQTQPRDHDELHTVFSDIVAADEGYPQSPDTPPTIAEFRAYWLGADAQGEVVRCIDSGPLVGAYTMKPNGVGRAAHVANAGYIVARSARGQGLGEALVLRSLERARAQGFDAMQFNFVFERNPARRLYERLGFRVVGRVPQVIGDQAVLIYHRRL